MLLSRIIITLADKSIPIIQSTSREISFENLVHQGLLDLPKDPEQWMNIIAHHQGNSATALMTLIYYHFHGTREYEIIYIRIKINNFFLTLLYYEISYLIEPI